MSTMTLILVILTVLALLCICLSFNDKWPWSMRAGCILLAVVVLIGLATARAVGW